MVRPAALAVLLALTGCSTDTTTHTVETYVGTPSPREQADKVEASLRDGYGLTPDVRVTEASCPEIDPDAAGLYLCDLMADGTPFQMQVRMTPEPQPDGSTRMKIGALPLDVVLVQNLADTMAEQFQAQKGLAVDMACDSPPLRPSTPGDRFACTATLPQSGESAPLVVTITNENGGFDAQPGTL